MLRQVLRVIARKPTAVILSRGTSAIVNPINRLSTMFSNYDQENKTLFTPGPLMVSDRVKQAMLPDVYTRHADFEYVIEYVRNALLTIAQVTADKYTAIPLQGSGTVATEATIRTLFGRDSGTVVVLENGIYGKRIADICRIVGVDVKVIPVHLEKLDQVLSSTNKIAGVIAVHCETASGKINPIDTIGKMVKKKNDGSITYIVDAMTSFGAIPIDMSCVDVLVTSACKSLQGVPGISCVIADRSLIEKRRGKCSNLTLDLVSQYDSLEASRQFRFTAPTHVMLAFREALQEYEEEGGLVKRAERYKANSAMLKQKMSALGFSLLFNEAENPNGYFVTAFNYPPSTRFVFNEFYERLSDDGKVICPQAASHPRCFRISTIGDLQPDDVRQLVGSVKKVCRDMKIKVTPSKE